MKHTTSINTTHNTHEHTCIKCNLPHNRENISTETINRHKALTHLKRAAAHTTGNVPHPHGLVPTAAGQLPTVRAEGNTFDRLRMPLHTIASIHSTSAISLLMLSVNALPNRQARNITCMYTDPSAGQEEAAKTCHHEQHTCKSITHVHMCARTAQARQHEAARHIHQNSKSGITTAEQILAGMAALVMWAATNKIPRHRAV